MRPREPWQRSARLANPPYNVSLLHRRTGGPMLTVEEHLDNLVRHIELVREAGLLLGKRLMRQGEEEFGRLLIARVFVHDASKFYGVEWKYLHVGKDVPPD